MAKLRMTYKNLKALRKSKEYQALLVDLVSVGVVPKATAEGLLGYNIPANLITDDESSGTDDPINEGTEGSGTVTLLYYNDTGVNPEWETAEYTLPGEDIITFAQDAFSDDTINAYFIAEANPEYVEGTSVISDKYIAIDPSPETLESGMFVIVHYLNINQGKD